MTKTTETVGHEIINLFIDNDFTTEQILSTFAKLTSSLISSATAKVTPDIRERVITMADITAHFVNLLNQYNVDYIEHIEKEEGIS